MFNSFRLERRRKKQLAELHFAKKMIVAADVAISKSEIFGSISTEDVQREALAMFRLKVGWQVAYMALARQLKMRGLIVEEITVEKEQGK
ncbi:hypothetical protein [Streptomyces globisporus]|uniref:hypothetical protein n=1 Tax=Streptomyces globisporus TaxID=1908 RepID=UPI0037C85DBE